MHNENGSELRARGLEIRRQVLGDEYVDSVMQAVTDFSSPLQDLVIEYCWGTIWTRDSLDLRTRSLINIGILTALNRQHELKLHTRGAVNNGCTSDEIREALLQAAIYCGIPAAVDAFRATAGIMQEMESVQGKFASDAD